MTKTEIMQVIEALAHSQGYYARLYDTLKEHPEALEFLEKQNFPLLPRKEFTEKLNKLDSLRKDLYAGRYESFPGGEG